MMPLPRIRAALAEWIARLRAGHMSAAPVDLERFLEAQNHTYLQARTEIENGRKTGHWMWFIFPNWKGLGKSVFARKYAIESVTEARAYLEHPILGARLRRCSEILLTLEDKSAFEIFGTPDDLKLRSCMTLFAAISPSGSVFHRVLARFHGGSLDELTLAGMRKCGHNC